MNRDDSVEELMRTGFAAVKEENYKEAVKIGGKLIGRRHSSGFEIAGMAHQRQGEIESAIKLLEEGVSVASPVWVLWKLLGDCYSDADRFVDAEKAYITALTKDQADIELIELNRGIAFSRQGKWEEAEKALHRVIANRMRRRAEAELIHVAIDSGKIQVAAKRARELAEQEAFPEENYDRRTSSYISSSIAWGLFHGKDFERAKEYGLLAAELHPANSNSLRVIREVHGNRAHDATGYKLILNGELDIEVEGEIPAPFMRTLEVVAQDIDTALDYAREFFPESIRELLKVEEVSEFDVAKAEFEGVYFVSGYCFYPRDSE
jgi:tetratricopeptide (TPR) repeat protein